VVRELEAKVSWMGVISGDIPAVRRGGAEHLIGAKVITTHFAKVALTATHTRLDGNAVTRLQILNLGSNLHDRSRSLMAHNQRLYHREQAIPSETPLDPESNIGAADSNGAHSEEDLIILRLGDRQIFQPQISFLVQNCTQIIHLRFCGACHFEM
jgi:hypothetical protein